MPSASRKLSLELDEHTATLASDALLSAADRLRRAAVTVSGELEAERRATGKDIRTGALRVVETLGEAAALEEAAAALQAAWAASTDKPARRRKAETAGGDPSPGDDDGDAGEGDASATEAAEVLAAIEADPDVAAARAALAGAGAGAPALPDGAAVAAG